MCPRTLRRYGLFGAIAALALAAALSAVTVGGAWGSDSVPPVHKVSMGAVAADGTAASPPAIAPGNCVEVATLDAGEVAGESPAGQVFRRLGVTGVLANLVPGQEAEAVVTVEDGPVHKVFHAPMVGAAAGRPAAAFLTTGAQHDGDRAEVLVCVRRNGGIVPPAFDAAMDAEMDVVASLPAATFASAGFTVVTGFGISNLDPRIGIYRTAAGEEMSGRTIVPAMPYPSGPFVLAQLEPVVAPLVGPAAEVVAIVPYPGDRTGFVVRAVSPDAVWNAVISLVFEGSSFRPGFTAPTVLYAYDERTFVLILPDSLVPAGAAVGNVGATISGGESIFAAPPAALLNPGTATPWYIAGGGPADWGVNLLVCNPRDEEVNVDGDSVGVQGFTSAAAQTPDFDAELEALIGETLTGMMDPFECLRLEFTGDDVTDFGALLDLYVGPDPDERDDFLDYLEQALFWEAEDGPAVR